MIPADKRILKDLANENPDAVVVSPMNMRYSEEVEYVKAAIKLQIPTIVPVYSWDNLTTKGLYHLVPHITLVWNHIQAREAEEIHHIPHDKLVITGAPFFDKWFAMGAPKESYQRFCQKRGLDPQRPFVLYLGSSVNIAPDETWLVDRLYQRIQNHANHRIQNLGMLVRPHPANARIYAQLDQSEITVWPKDGALPEDDETQADFFDMLYYCTATIGINTSGMIDAVINDKPCIAVMTAKYRATQAQALHFKQLLDADVIEVAYSLSDALKKIEQILGGEDRCREQRKKFVEKFVRPRGVKRAAGEVAAVVIQSVAEGRSVAQIRQRLP